MAELPVLSDSGQQSPPVSGGADSSRPKLEVVNGELNDSSEPDQPEFDKTDQLTKDLKDLFLRRDLIETCSYFLQDMPPEVADLVATREVRANARSDYEALKEFIEEKIEGNIAISSIHTRIQALQQILKREGLKEGYTGGFEIRVRELLRDLLTLIVEHEVLQNTYDPDDNFWKKIAGQIY